MYTSVGCISFVKNSYTEFHENLTLGHSRTDGQTDKRVWDLQKVRPVAVP